MIGLEPNKKTIKPTWEEIISYCDKIQKLLKKREFEPNIIVTASRGGLVPTAIISHRLGIRKVFTINAEKSVNDEIYSEWKKLKINFFIPKEEVKGKKVLLIDDIFASGVTMNTIKSHLEALSPKKIVTASLVVNLIRSKKYKAELPDIYIRGVTDWIVFPWE